MAVHFAALYGVDYDMDLIHHWIDHYRAFHFDHYKVWVHSGRGDQGTDVARNVSTEALEIFREAGFNPSIVHGEFRDGSLRHGLMTSHASFLPAKDHLVTADSDEFHDMPPDYKEMIVDHDIIHGYMIDRYDDTLHDAIEGLPLMAQYPIEGLVIRKVCDMFGVQARCDNHFANKIMACRCGIPVNFIGSHCLVDSLRHGTFDPGLDVLRDQRVLHFTWRSTILDRMAGKSYFKAELLWYVQKFFGGGDEPHPAVLKKHQWQLNMQEAKGWVPCQATT